MRHRAKVKAAETYCPVDIKDLSPGVYSGKWGGYYIELHEDLIPLGIRLTMDTGVRGMNIPCTVTIEAGGKVSVEVHKKT